MDVAYLAGVFADMFPAAQAAADPGPAEGVQLHRRGGVHRGAHHTWFAPHVPDPQSQQGPPQSALSTQTHTSSPHSQLSPHITC